MCCDQLKQFEQSLWHGLSRELVIEIEIIAACMDDHDGRVPVQAQEIQGPRNVPQARSSEACIEAIRIPRRHVRPQLVPECELRVPNPANPTRGGGP